MNKEGDKSQGEQDDQTAQVFRYARIKQSARKVRNVLIGVVFESKFEQFLNSDLWKKSCLRLKKLGFRSLSPIFGHFQPFSTISSMLPPTRLSTSMSTQKFLKKYFAKSNPSPTPDEQLLDLFKLPENLYSTIHEHQKSKSSEIIFQDKASCLPPLVLLHQLRIGEPCEIIDACSAPGNKTTGLAAKLSSMQVDHFVQLTACEIDKVRFEILNQNLVRCGALRVKAKNVDFFKYTVVFESDIKRL